MKYIKKGSPPPELAKWFNKQPIEKGRRINCTYNDMDRAVKDAVKARLLQDQGLLCCYTGIHIEAHTSHIEHFKPQSQCEGHEDIDYNNLLAAYPLAGCDFGARARGNKPVPINPMSAACEGKFQFNLSGKISPADKDDRNAIATIKNLRLDHPSLIEMRQHAIDEVLYRHNERLSDAQLVQVARHYCDRMANRQFRHFCFVIASAAKELQRKQKQYREHQKANRRKKRK